MSNLPCSRCYAPAVILTDKEALCGRCAISHMRAAAELTHSEGDFEEQEFSTRGPRSLALESKSSRTTQGPTFP